VSLRVWAYQDCGTCRKALKLLAERNVAYQMISIREKPPGISDLRVMLAHVGGDLSRLFNTSGGDYRAMNMKERLPRMSVDEALSLLSAHGNLVKRPFALGEHRGAVGFKPEEWTRLFG